MKTGSRSGGKRSAVSLVIPDLIRNLWPNGWAVLVVGICVWGIVESGYGLFQVLGWRSSRHALFALTGHFQNPGPFGGFIACVMAVAGAWVMGFADRGRRMTGGSRRMTEEETGMMTEGAGMAEDSSLSLRMTRRSLRMTMVVNGIAWAALGMGFLVLPASMSRAGWLGLAVALGVEWMRSPIRSGMTKEGSGTTQPSRHAGQRSGIRWVAGVALCLALLVGAFLLKPDSALGRVHVWRMECRAIAERPWTGAGPGMGPWAYGEAQEAFFREHLETASPATIRVAGCPDHAYNEYLGIGVEHGIPAMVLAVLLVVSSIAVLHKAGSPLAAGLTAWSVFACASYPLAVPQLRILGSVFIVAAVITGALQTGGRCLRYAALLPLVSAVALTLWIKIPGQARNDGRMVRNDGRMVRNDGRMVRNDAAEDIRAVYAEGYALHQAGRYAESTELLEKGALMSCDPMFEIIMGKNAEALGDFGRAAALYEKAHYMVPSRLYPLVRLMRLQVRQGRDGEALATARQIVAMPVNGRNAGMVRLHGDAAQALDSLKTVIGR